MAANERHRIHPARARLKFSPPVFAALFFPLVALAGWREDLTPLKPGPFPLPEPQVVQYHFGWAGFTAGHATVRLHEVTGGEAELSATGSTSGFARALWRLDAKHEALADARTLRPLRMDQSEVYSSKTITSKVRFSTKGIWSLRTVEPPDKNPPKPKRFDLPESFDLHSALLFARSQPLRRGDTISMVVFPTSSPYLTIIKVLGDEDISVRAGKFHTLKCELKLFSIDKKLGLHPHRLFKRGFIWVSNDEKRLVVKAQVDIFIGSVWAELDSVKFSGPHD